MIPRYRLVDVREESVANIEKRKHPEGAWVRYEDHQKVVQEAYEKGKREGYNKGRDDYINWKPGVGG